MDEKFEVKIECRSEVVIIGDLAYAALTMFVNGKEEQTSILLIDPDDYT